MNMLPGHGWVYRQVYTHRAILLNMTSTTVRAITFIDQTAGEFRTFPAGTAVEVRHIRRHSCTVRVAGTLFEQAVTLGSVI
jgi:hypothetical protein